MAVAISLVAVHGKVSVCQLIVLAALEPLFHAINELVIGKYLKVTDLCGGLRVCTFGAFFGLGLSLLTWRYGAHSKRRRLLSTATNQLHVFVSAVLFYFMWPSFCGSLLAAGDKKHRAVVNCFLSSTGGGITSFAISSLLDEHNRFSVVNTHDHSRFALAARSRT